MNALTYYCRADTLFYDRPKWSTGSLFPFGRRDLPTGWVRTLDDPWISVDPHPARLPEQGWKVHVSVTAKNASDVIDLVGDYCLARSISFKFLGTPALHHVMNSKSADRAGSGKLITIYPVGDDQLRSTTEDLTHTLAGLTGPYILSDLRLGDGPLYVRFGGFVQRHVPDPDGDDIPAVRRPDGTLVPDVRGPSFVLPEWVDLPNFLRTDPAAPVRPSDMPYEMLKALHFSNGGGIYLARLPHGEESFVLREARPHAGLDGSGVDAVTRLYQEADALRALGDLDFVPGFIETFTVWEHHYLAEEYIEGEHLGAYLATRNPLVTGTTNPQAIAEYTATMLSFLDQLSGMLGTLHERGWVFADLHPRNIMVRPDGRLTLVDFESAFRPGLDRAPSLGCPGFVAGHAVAGSARDDYALNCLRVAAFLPLTEMFDHDPALVDELVDAVEEVFDLPRAITAPIRSGLRRPTTEPTGDASISGLFTAAATAPDGPQHAELTGAIVDAIRRSATPERTDRLFPGDPKGLRDGGYSLSYGAAGVLCALRLAGASIDDDHVDWLSAAVRRARDRGRSGLYTGMHGAALVLQDAGRLDEAEAALDAVGSRSSRLSLSDGLAGIGLALRHFAMATGDTHWCDELSSVTEHLADRLSAQVPIGAGLLKGGTGPALFFLRRYQDTAEDAYLDLARRALELDLKRRPGPDLGTGGAGMVEALSLYGRYRDEPEVDERRIHLLQAVKHRFTPESGLFGGRAGLLAVLSRHQDDPENRSAAAEHRRRLAWHAVRYERGIAFPGRGLLRLSMDLHTGSAGVVIGLQSAAPRPGRAGTPQDSWWQALGLPIWP